MKDKNKIKEYMIIILIILTTSFVTTQIREMRAEHQQESYKPIFENNTASYPSNTPLTMKQAAKIINTAESAYVLNYSSGEKIIGTIQGQNYKGKRRVFELRNINKLFTPKKTTVGDIKYADMAKRTEEFYYGNATDYALNDRFIYKVGELAGQVVWNNSETAVPGLESVYKVLRNNTKEMVLSTVMESVIHDGTSTTVTYTLKYIGDKWLIADKEYSPNVGGNKNVAVKASGDNWFIVGSAVPIK